MKAIVQDEYGSPDVLELTDIDKPELGDDEVLVRIRAAGWLSLDEGDNDPARFLSYLVAALRTVAASSATHPDREGVTP